MAGPLTGRRIAVVGAGWAGLSASVRACQSGAQLTLYEMSRHWGGRARSDGDEDGALDNGQHILIGAYTSTLALMRELGIHADEVLCRTPLVLRFPDGQGLSMPPGAAIPAFARAILGFRGWRWVDRLSLLTHAAGWTIRRFECDPAMTVADLCQDVTGPVRQLLIDPLCVAALNTPASSASAAVFLRVLHDALLSGPGSADLLLPRRPLGRLLPQRAAEWLHAHGAMLRAGHRVQQLLRTGTGWEVDHEPFDQVVLACTATEAARLTATIDPLWTARASALPHEPIVTVYLQADGARLPFPMMALQHGPDAPAQFAFDHGAIGGPAGRFAFAISGAANWVAAGLDATAKAVQAQAQRAFPPGTWPPGTRWLATRADKRATFRCTPGLDRPPARIAQGLVGAGDYIAGPYPATLEGAVRAGDEAVRMLSNE